MLEVMVESAATRLNPFTAAHDLLQSALLTALPKSTLLSLRSAFLSQIPPSFLKFGPLPLLTTSVRRRPSWLDVYGPHEMAHSPSAQLDTSPLLTASLLKLTACLWKAHGPPS